MGESSSKLQGNKTASAEADEADIDTGVETIRVGDNNAQKKKNQKPTGRLYVIVRHPQIEGSKYTTQQMEETLLELQKNFSKYEIVLDVGRMDRYSGYVTSFNSNDPKKLYPKPRIMVDVLYYNIRQGRFQEMGPFPRTSINMGTIRSVIQATMDPDNVCFIDFRQRPLYQESGALPYEALLRI